MRWAYSIMITHMGPETHTGHHVDDDDDDDDDDINCGKSYNMIWHITANLSTYYISKFECSHVQLYRIAIQIKRDVQLLIYSKYVQKCHLLNHMSMLFNLQHYSTCSKYMPLAHRRLRIILLYLHFLSILTFWYR